MSPSTKCSKTTQDHCQNNWWTSKMYTVSINKRHITLRKWSYKPGDVISANNKCKSGMRDIDCISPSSLHSHSIEEKRLCVFIYGHRNIKFVLSIGVTIFTSMCKQKHFISNYLADFLLLKAFLANQVAAGTYD